MLKWSILLLLSLNSYSIDKSICGESDDREPSYDQKIGRASKIGQAVGCTVTMIGKSCAISAGHCVGSLEQVSFNIPHYDDLAVILPKKEDIYKRTKDYLRYKDQGVGDDWAVIKLMKNEITGKYPGDVQGYYPLEFAPTLKVGDQITITGYGIDSKDSKKSFSQQIHHGEVEVLGGWFRKSKLNHTVDTTGGNSGSTIIHKESGKIVGIHSHGGCRASGGTNKGTYLAKNRILIEAIKQCLNSESELD